uniref:Peptidase_M14 domain-containing protein n=1 Tax=Heterorhabditis bacteriophora TaxID=37862 RepID=A0A1I7WTS3_HETBA
MKRRSIGVNIPESDSLTVNKNKSFDDGQVSSGELLFILNHVYVDMVVQEMARTRMRVPFASRIVFDIDSSMCDDRPLPSIAPPQTLTCDDRMRSSSFSLFQYITMFKMSTKFKYYQVSNTKSNIQYTFEIINCLKTASMFSRGMQPVMYSVREALAGRKGWVRVGEDVCYYRNLYTSTEENGSEEERGKKRLVYFSLDRHNRILMSTSSGNLPFKYCDSYILLCDSNLETHFYSIRFKVTFQNKGDICYFAYHYPYTYSYLEATLSKCLSRLTHSIYYRKDVIGTSLGGNKVNLLTITAPGSRSDIHQRDTILLTARVHPGESNSSWMMHGIIDFLLTSLEATAEELRSQFVFKVVPMLNPDGVVNGSHRCSLAGVDLNRVWDRPNQILHPEIHLTKSIVQYMVDVLRRPPFLFVDLHGHSRRSNIFLFGNNPEESWRVEDKVMKHDYEFMTLAEILEEKSSAFSINNCRFSIMRDKESSARVAVWRQFGVKRAYTLEATYCGFETGKYQGYQIGTCDLKKMGQHLVESILEVRKLSNEKSSKRTVRQNSRSRRTRSSSTGEAKTD